MNHQKKAVMRKMTLMTESKAVAGRIRDCDRISGKHFPCAYQILSRGMLARKGVKFQRQQPAAKMKT